MVTPSAGVDGAISWLAHQLTSRTVALLVRGWSSAGVVAGGYQLTSRMVIAPVLGGLRSGVVVSGYQLTSRTVISPGLGVGRLAAVAVTS